MKKKLLLIISSIFLLSAAAMNEINSKTPEPFNADNDPVIQLSETMIEKIHDRVFMEYVHQAQSLGIRKNQVFKVFIQYKTGQKELIQKILQPLDVEDVYFYQYTDLISIQAEAGTLATLLAEKNVLSLEPDQISKPSGVCTAIRNMD